MGSRTIQADRAATAVPLSFFVQRDAGVTGLTVVVRMYNGNNLSQFLDHNDGAFKDGGHTTPFLTMTAEDVTNNPGSYVIDGGFDLSAITIPAATESIQVRYEITAGGEIGGGVDWIQLDDRLVDLIWDELNRGADHNIKDSTGKQQRQAVGGGIDVETQDIVSATATTAVLAASESAIDGFLTHRYIAIVSGLGIGQGRVITSYVGASRTATVSRAWDTTPDATSDYLLLLSAESRPVPLDVRDAMKLAPTVGAPAVDSVDEHLDDILIDTDATIPANIIAARDVIRGVDLRDLTNLAGAGWVAANNLVQAHNKLDALQVDIDNFENITRIKVSIPTMQIPGSGSTTYEFYFNLKDDQGNPVDVDASVTLEATSSGGAAGDRDGNLGSTTMTNIGIGRYRGTYIVASTHNVNEAIHLLFSWAEGGNADVIDKAFTVLSSISGGYLASDRTRDDAIAIESTAILVDTDVTIPALIAALSGIDIADVQTALTNQGYTIGRAVFLDQLDAPNIPADIATLLAGVELNASAVASVWAYDLDANFAEGGDLEQAGGVLHFIRQLATNIGDEQGGNPGSYTIRNDADTGDIGSYTLRDFAGNGTVNVGGAPAQRGAFTP